MTDSPYNHYYYGGKPSVRYDLVIVIFVSKEELSSRKLASGHISCSDDPIKHRDTYVENEREEHLLYSNLYDSGIISKRDLLSLLHGKATVYPISLCIEISCREDVKDYCGERYDLRTRHNQRVSITNNPEILRLPPFSQSAVLVDLNQFNLEGKDIERNTGVAKIGSVDNVNVLTPYLSKLLKVDNVRKHIQTLAHQGPSSVHLSRQEAAAIIDEWLQIKLKEQQDVEKQLEQPYSIKVST